MACHCDPQQWPYPDFAACKWAEEESVMEMPGNPSVWRSKSTDGDKQSNCRIANEECQLQCAASTQINSANNSVSSCFGYSSTEKVHAICMCADGTYPSQLEGFELASSMDPTTNKMIGSISNGYKIAPSIFVLLLILL